MSESVPQIYVVDDDVSVRGAVGSLIRSAGLSVKTFASAQAMGHQRQAASCRALNAMKGRNKGSPSKKIQ